MIEINNIYTHGYHNGSAIISPHRLIADLLHIADMDESYGTDADEEYVDDHDYDDADDDTDDDKDHKKYSYIYIYIYCCWGCSHQDQATSGGYWGQDLSQTRLGAACRDTTQSWMLLTQFPIEFDCLYI